MSVKIGINGFGRIGRNFFRAAKQGNFDFDFVGVNDLGDAATMAHLLKYDSVHGRFPGEVAVGGQGLIVDGDELRFFAERDPANLPWKEVGAEIVIESTGHLHHPGEGGRAPRGRRAEGHHQRPATGEDLTVVLGVNDDAYDPANHHVISNASCTTNCVAPMAKVIDDAFGIEQGFMTTVHAYTNDQSILDLPHKDLRRARAAAVNIIPTSTGAAKATGAGAPAPEGQARRDVDAGARARRFGDRPGRHGEPATSRSTRSTPRSRRRPRREAWPASSSTPRTPSSPPTSWARRPRARSTPAPPW